jgi:hypothetical protein
VCAVSKVFASDDVASYHFPDASYMRVWHVSVGVNHTYTIVSYLRYDTHTEIIEVCQASLNSRNLTPRLRSSSVVVRGSNS